MYETQGSSLHKGKRRAGRVEAIQLKWLDFNIALACDKSCLIERTKLLGQAFTDV